MAFRKLIGSASLCAKKSGWKSMALIKTVETGLYRIPLTVTLSDSTHGEIAAFELVTCRVRDSDGAEGIGYTYTVGRNGRRDCRHSPAGDS